MPAVPQVGRADEEGAIGKEQVGEVIDLVFALKKVRIRGEKNMSSSVFRFNRVMLTDSLRRYCKFGPSGPVVCKVVCKEVIF